jgi:LacI family transcriptional regulator
LNLPAVLLDHHLNLPRIGTLRSDSQQCGQLAVERLAALGHRRIACASWQREDLNPWFPRGYLLGMRAAGLKPRKAWQLDVELTSQGARDAIKRLISLSPRPTALVCFNNTFARHIVEAAIDRGLQIPGDLSVFGGGGEVVSGLTCNQINWTALGRQAMQMLLAAIDAGPEKPSEHQLVPYHFEVGNTTEKWRG